MNAEELQAFREDFEKGVGGPRYNAFKADVLDLIEHHTNKRVEQRVKALRAEMDRREAAAVFKDK